MPTAVGSGRLFDSYEDVPQRGITLTMPTLFRVAKLILSVPGSRKAKIIRQTLEEPISTKCPATILRTHRDATLYFDLESAAELDTTSLESLTYDTEERCDRGRHSVRQDS